MAPRRHKLLRRPPRSRRAIALLLIALLVWAVSYWLGPADQVASPQALPDGFYRVDRVVDGDTLLLANQLRVRLIGADTPETVRPNWPVEPWGPEATAFTRQFVADGQVWLDFDGRRLDHYGRLLAHVSVGGQLLSEELVRAGLAKVEIQYSFDPQIKQRLLEAEQEAQRAGRGIWSR